MLPRWLARIVFVALFAVLAAALGTTTALLTSRAGKNLLARLISEQSAKLVRGSLTAAKVAAALVVVEQLAEALFLGVSLAEHPALMIACLGALGFPVPRE